MAMPPPRNTGYPSRVFPTRQMEKSAYWTTLAIPLQADAQRLWRPPFMKMAGYCMPRATESFLSHQQAGASRICFPTIFHKALRIDYSPAIAGTQETSSPLSRRRRLETKMEHIL